jgi:polyhydroxybutyrate depolymerase
MHLVATTTMNASAILGLVACLSVGCVTPASSEQPPVCDGDGKCDGTDTARPYQLVVPSSDARSPRPLVLMLHGYSNDAAFIESYFHGSALAERENFLLAIPQGTKDAFGLRFWNAGPACCNFTGSDVDDVAYLTHVIDEVEAEHDVDPSQIFVIGHSNGGFMAHRLACELSSRIAGIASLAGAAPMTGCTTTDDVAVLQIHGDEDETISYDGGELGGADATYPSARETVAGWAKRDGCEPGAVDDTALIDLVTPTNAADTTISRHGGCRGGAAELWTIHGGTHIPELVPSFTADVYRFLADHRRW